MRPSSHPFQTLNRMSRFYSPFTHSSIQLFSCIWHLHTMLQISSCNTYSQKRCLDHNDLNNYRPVFHLCFIAKILGKLVLSLASFYLNSHNLYNTCQSAYCPALSTETALLKVANDQFHSLNKGNMAVLALPDFSSAFDTIDHPILVHRVHTDFGFTDTVLQWSSSYLTDRTHYVSLSNHCSVHSGCRQDSVHGPMLFTMCIEHLSAIIDSNTIHLPMTYNYRCLRLLTKYQGYFTLCSHILVMSKLGQLRTCLNLMTTRQNSCLSLQKN